LFEPEKKTYDNFLRVSELLEELLGHRFDQLADLTRR
jgi:hypothetical protein